MPILLVPRSQALKALLCGAAIAQLGHAGALAQGSDQSPGIATTAPMCTGSVDSMSPSTAIGF